jgi:hypothetical protein
VSSIQSMPLCPAPTPFQRLSTPMPNGETAPTPVTSTSRHLAFIPASTLRDAAADFLCRLILLHS